MTNVVFLHGFLGFPAEWQPVIETLGSDWSVTAMCIPLGDSWDHGLQLLVEQLPKECVLVGYSLGARLALGATLTAHKKVLGLCLISPHPGLQSEARTVRRSHDEQVAHRIQAETWEQFLFDWYSQPIFCSLSDAMRAAWVQERTSLDRRHQVRLLSCYSLAEQPDYWPRLGELPEHTTVVAGEQDLKFVELARRMKLQAPHLQVRIVPAVGHAIHREQPAAIQDILQQFLKAVTKETGHE